MANYEESFEFDSFISTVIVITTEMHESTS